jgi:hypothetical protein
VSHEARLMCRLTLILVSTLVYGDLTVVRIVTGRIGAPAPKNLSPEQIAFYRAGHAHASVLTILSLQVAIEYAAVPNRLIWPFRIGDRRRQANT